MDYSNKALSFARAFASDVEFCDHTDEVFDAFVMVEVIEHINPKQMDEVLRRVKRNLKSDGRGIITTPHMNIPLNPKHFQHFTKESLTYILEKHFQIETFAYISKNSLLAGIIQRLLSNRFFNLQYRPAVAFLYRLYKKYNAYAQEYNASQVFVVVRNKQ